MARLSVQEAGGPTVLAFLDMIAYSELGYGLLEKSDDGYNVLVGSTAMHPKLFMTYDDHPQIFVDLGNLTSSAAGRYQFLAKTWDTLCHQHGFDNFQPETQDKGAIALIAGRGALDLVLRGQIAAAITKCNHEWASFPGSPYGQPVHTMDDMLTAYHAALPVYTRPDFRNVTAGVTTTAPVPK